MPGAEKINKTVFELGSWMSLINGQCSCQRRRPLDGRSSYMEYSVFNCMTKRCQFPLFARSKSRWNICTYLARGGFVNRETTASWRNIRVMIYGHLILFCTETIDMMISSFLFLLTRKRVMKKDMTFFLGVIQFWWEWMGIWSAQLGGNENISSWKQTAADLDINSGVIQI